MALVYIDTNVFLDFYQAATDRLAVFAEIEKHAGRLVLTEQTVNEFYRNRIGRLSELKSKIGTSSEIRLFFTAVVRELDEFSKWQKARDQALAYAKAMQTRLDSWIKDESSDLVCTAFSRVAAAAKN